MTARLASAVLALTAQAAQAQAVEGVDVSSLALSLVIVVAIIIAGAFVLRRTPLAANRANGPIKLVSSLALGPKERLVLVDVRGVEMLVASSPAGMSIVPTRAPAAEPPQSQRDEPVPRRVEELERVLALRELS